jgi:acetyl coenzyme A synthetase (ADP forming)-like protein
MELLRRTGGESAGFEVILRDGQSLRVRPIRADDKKRLEDFFYRLSPRTRYLRFGYTKNYITDEELTHFTEIHPPQKNAFVGTAGEGEKERIVAVARWYLLPDEKSAEVAFVVEDNIQVRGIGTALVEQLASAALRYRIKKFEAGVLPENTRMLDVFDESGFKLQKTLEEGVYRIIIDLEEQEEFEKRQAIREHIARSAGVKRLLYPKRVAVVGASRNPESVGGAVFKNLLYGNFKGTIFPVNPNAASVGGVLSYPSVLDVPGDIDLAVIVVPAEKVLDVVDECGSKGVPGLLIISSGFGETKGRGREREDMLREKVLAYGMRMIGPNCLGVINSDSGVSLNATFAPTAPPSGCLSVSSQSGALGLALLDYAKGLELGIAHFVSIGNRVDISSNDLMEFWEDDDNTGVIILYMESFGNPRKFGRIARRVSRKKPVIAVKAGRSEVGARAASSHTGALAASDVAADAMFRQAGVIRVNTIEEMFNVAKTLALQPLPKGPKVGIITNAGGPGVLTADACIGWGLQVPALSSVTQEKLMEFLPGEASTANPVDMIASASPESYKKAISVMLESSDVDSVIVIYIPPLVTHPEDVAASIRQAMSGYEGDKPVLCCFMMSGQGKIDLKIGPNRHLPLFAFPEDAVQAIARASQYSFYKNLDEGRIPKFSDIDSDRARAGVFASQAPAEEGRWLMPEDSVKLLKAYGISASEVRTALTEDEAASAANELGFPLAMKLRSSAIVHKTDVGGIALGLKSADELRDAFNAMRRRMADRGMSEKMEGVYLQKMAGPGQEVIIGMSQDAVFGPLIMVGLGGIHVELIKDVAFSIHPLRDLDPERMLKQLKGLPILEGWRGSRPKDIASIKDVVLRFSALIEDFPEIEQMEINPLMVFDEGQGCLALDARIMIKALSD